MSKRIVSVAILILILIGMLTMAFGIRKMMPSTSSHLWLVGPLGADFSSIQEAINNASVSDGDIIEVMNKSTPYYEHVTVHKSLTIRRYQGQIFVPIVDGSGDGVVFNITASDVVISQLNIRNGNTGIHLSFGSANCFINDTQVTSNSMYGMWMSESSNNTLRDNEIYDNNYNFRVTGLAIEHFVHDIDVSNTVDEKSIYYWINRHNESITATDSAGYVAIVNSTNIAVKGQNITNNGQGILVAYTKNSIILQNEVKENYGGISLMQSNSNIISGNYMENNMVGIRLLDCSDNEISNNKVVNNGIGFQLSSSNDNILAGNSFNHSHYGVSLSNSSNSIIYHNNFIDSQTQDAAVYLSLNTTWDLNGVEGNYWSDNVNLIDNDLNGICDEPFTILTTPEEIDYYPLTELWNLTRQMDVTFGVFGVVPFGSNEPPYYVTTFSDHVVATKSFELNLNLAKITFNITAGSDGFCNITIPRVRLDFPFDLTIDDTPVTPIPTPSDEYWSLYFEYTNGTHRIKIIGKERGYILGDVNFDGYVELLDFFILSANFGSHENMYFP